MLVWLDKRWDVVVNINAGFDGAITILANPTKWNPTLACGTDFVVKSKQASLPELVSEFVFSALFSCHNLNFPSTD